MSNKTIIIEIDGGCLMDVRNLPEGWSYELIDHDCGDVEEDEHGFCVECGRDVLCGHEETCSHYDEEDEV